VIGAAFYGLYLFRFLHYYSSTHRLLGVLFTGQLAVTSLVFLVRRGARSVSSRPSDYAIALCATVVPLLIRPATYAFGWQAVVGSVLQICGVTIWLLGFASLGRSFGIVAADRGVKTSGPYAFVRHPLYLSYMIGGAGFLMQNLSTWNVAVTIVGTGLSLARIRAEERHLSDVSAEYRSYARRVRWRLIPGVWLLP
jgi:protein-S-isoprenylcysteine O-methyltransferase Ste14